MLYPPMSSLLEKISNRYLLVNVIARRARQISLEAERAGVTPSEKPITQAIREVSEGRLTACIRDEYQ